ncbi:MAG: hypothetical protein LR015_12225 [Verrucomicrobia bacterium]|nr:hypothetical protein [Verrucomicrobiota bacterium]
MVDRVSRYLEQRLASESRSSISFRDVIASRRSIKPHLVDGFLFLEGRLSVATEDVFQQDPLRLLRVFRHMQQLKATIDFELSRLISENLALLTPDIVNSEDANRCFRSILQTKGDVYPALRKMNTTGVLSKVLPEWANLHCLVQHEYYHRYTADEHTLNTIRELDNVFSGQESALTRKYRIEIEETHLPALLYLILLLHDIGKGFSIQGHAQFGAEMSGPILERMGVVPEIRQKNFVFDSKSSRDGTILATLRHR